MNTPRIVYLPTSETPQEAYERVYAFEIRYGHAEAIARAAAEFAAGQVKIHHRHSVAAGDDFAK